MTTINPAAELEQAPAPLANPRRMRVSGGARFRQRLATGLLHSCYQVQDHNTDYLRFPASRPRRTLRWLGERALQLANTAGFVRRPRDLSLAAQRMTTILESIEAFEWLLDLLEDQASRDLLLALLLYRVLGSRRVALPTNNAGYWSKAAQVDTLVRQRGTFTRPPWHLSLYDVPARHGRIQLHAHALNILHTFLLEQYAYRRDGACIDVEEGDIVVDGGTCWGDTTLCFAEKTGANGKVYGFEFDARNLEVLRANLAHNPEYARHITTIERALSDRSGEIIEYVPDGPATSLVNETSLPASRVSVTSASIDDLVVSERLPRVDFIKMDIEGFELRALRGAEATLRRFVPKLAISVYHREMDLVDIPRYLAGLDLGYRFFLSHSTIHLEETVLFARA